MFNNFGASTLSSLMRAQIPEELQLEPIDLQSDYSGNRDILRLFEALGPEKSYDFEALGPYAKVGPT
ncbi:hypothetical protein TNCV_4759381 [Trichonephila clavipes]|nr:hypothetical protein TNCV_4759381 [Trichonephila clavipes]